MKPRLYGLLAEFESPEHLVRAAAAAREQGFTRLDGYTPFPVVGLIEALGFRRTRLPLVIFMGGVIGCLAAVVMQYYAAVISYPINVGGRPLNSWPSWIPVTFELTVLIASLAAVLGLLGLSGLPMPYHPLFNVPRFALASRDRFFLCIESTDPRFDLESTRSFLALLGAREVFEVPE